MLGEHTATTPERFECADARAVDQHVVCRAILKTFHGETKRIPIAEKVAVATDTAGAAVNDALNLVCSNVPSDRPP